VDHAVFVGERSGGFDVLGDVPLLAGPKEAKGIEHDTRVGAEDLGAEVIVVGQMRGPGGFEEHGATALQFNEGDRKIIDIELGFFIDFALSPVAASFAPGTELGVGLAGDRGGIEFAHEEERTVERMHADVVGAATAGELFLGKPGADAGNATAAGPGGLGVVDLAEFTLVDEVASGLDLGAESHILADHQGDSTLFGFGDEFGGILGIGGHGFVDHDVFAGAEGGETDGSVEVIRQGNGDDIDIRAREEGFIVGDEFRNIKRVGGFLAASCRNFGEGNDVGGGVLLKATDVIETDRTRADNGDVERGLRGAHGVGEFN